MSRIPHHSEIDYKKVLFLIVLAVLCIGVVIGGWQLTRNYLELKAYKDDRDVALLQEKLSKHFLLPEEEPLIATVTDVERLKQEQPFYQKAQNGDKVFIWKDKALIYRDSEDKIVDFGIIIANTPQEVLENETLEVVEEEPNLEEDTSTASAPAETEE